MTLYRFKMVFMLALPALIASALAIATARRARAGDGNPVAMRLTAPALVGDDWLNTSGPLSLAKLRGRVVALHFWTFGCINCRHNLPSYTRWQQRFEKAGVEFIGVHTPETDSERRRENVVRRVKELGITYPILVDAGGENWARWGQQYWPTVYLIDRRGRVRYRWTGELEYGGAGGEKRMAGLIQSLLNER
jgi:thiol-disulfide isomerase/thioredoxin